MSCQIQHDFCVSKGSDFQVRLELLNDDDTAMTTANETAKAQLADLTLLLNSVRSVIELAITNDNASADTLLSQADAISLSMADLTPTKIGETKTMFGL